MPGSPYYTPRPKLDCFCAVCGAAFKGRSGAMYCGKKCRTAASNKRRRDKLGLNATRKYQREYYRKRKSAFVGPPPPTPTLRARECAVCGVRFSGIGKAKYCSARCKRRVNTLKHVHKTWWFIGPPEAPRGTIVSCQVCDKEFPKSKGGRERYCSKACRHRGRKLKHKCFECGGDFISGQSKQGAGGVARRVRCTDCKEEKRRSRTPAYTQVSFAPCELCGETVCLRPGTKRAFCRNHIKVYGRHSCTSIASGLHAVECKVCGVLFSRLPAPGRTNTTCSSECSDALARGQASRDKARRRARIAQGESFDPFYIFELDGWKCRHCRRVTPRRLRGSHEAAAPELDHIVPISLGGSHTRENTQLLCRECNGRKGARSMEDQMLLVG